MTDEKPVNVQVVLLHHASTIKNCASNYVREHNETISEVLIDVAEQIEEIALRNLDVDIFDFVREQLTLCQMLLRDIRNVRICEIDDGKYTRELLRVHCEAVSEMCSLVENAICEMRNVWQGPESSDEEVNE